MYDYQKYSSTNEEEEDDDYYYNDYNDKRKKRQQQKTMNKGFNRLRAEFYNRNLTSISNRRLVVIILVILVIIFFVHNSPTSEVEIILDVNKMQLEKVDRSVILDTLRKRNKDVNNNVNANNNDNNNNIDDALADNSPGDQPGIPAFRLITEFKNGIYFYNIHEPTESWVLGNFYLLLYMFIANFYSISKNYNIRI